MPNYLDTLLQSIDDTELQAVPSREVAHIRLGEQFTLVGVIGGARPVEKAREMAIVWQSLCKDQRIEMKRPPAQAMRCDLRGEA